MFNPNLGLSIFDPNLSGNKSAFFRVWEHTQRTMDKHTPPDQWANIFAAAPGEWPGKPCSREPQPLPVSIENQTHNLQVTSLTV